jgi:hypothetical protein
MLLCAALAVAASSDRQPQALHTSASTTTRTATFGSQPIGEVPVLGGSASAFVAKFGLPQEGDTATSKTFNIVEQGHAMQLYVDADVPTLDGGNHVYVVNINPPPVYGAGLNPTVAVAFIKTFLPPDAKHVRDTMGSNGMMDHIYLSAGLAATWSGQYFENYANNKPNPPGTFDWQCPPNPHGAGVAMCEMGIGTD